MVGREPDRRRCRRRPPARQGRRRVRDHFEPGTRRWPTPAGPPSPGRRSTAAAARRSSSSWCTPRRPLALGCGEPPLNVIGMNNIAPAIMQYGTEAQKRTLLPRMMRADDIWCQGMSEPEAGSDLAPRCAPARCGWRRSSSSTDRRSGPHSGIAPSGVSCMCAPIPDAPKHKGISCLIVDMSLPGIEVRPLVTLNGDADFAEVFFNDVRVPGGRLARPAERRLAGSPPPTLSHERAGAARLYTEMQVRLAELVADLAGVRSISARARRSRRRCGASAKSRSASSISRCCASGRSRRFCTAATPSGRRAWPRRSGVRSGRTSLRWPSTCSARIGGEGPLGRLPLDIARADHRGRHDADQQEHHRPARPGVATLMNLELTDEQVALRDTVRSFLAEKASIVGHVRPLLDDPTGTTEAVWRGLADLGTTGLLGAAGIRRRRHDDGRGRHRPRRTRRRPTPGTVAVQRGRRDLAR